MAKQKPRVYLAGPISGCNTDQVTRWRVRVKKRWSDEFDFIDPAEDIVTGENVQTYEVVLRDEAAIERADAVLANMWKESCGTAIGIVLARRKARTIVIVDSNYLNNRTLAYYADAVTPTITEGMRTLRALLRSQDALKNVMKLSGDEEPFDRGKLAESIRSACRTAKQNDILAPVEILPRVLERLTEVKPVRRRTITTTQIKDSVWEVLAELEEDNDRREQFAGIRKAWDKHERRGGRRRLPAGKVPVIRVHGKPQRVRVFSGKSHATIWGKGVRRLSEIPSPARHLFEEVLRLEGIAEIRLTTMSKGNSPGGEVRLEILASTSEGVIEGKCLDNAPKGQVQSFQIRVHDPDRTDLIRKRLIRHLDHEGQLRT